MSNHPLNNETYEADVQPVARRLQQTDFSGESVQRISLRAQLIDQANQRIAKPSVDFRTGRFSPVYALAGIAAAVTMLLIVVIAAPPSLSVTLLEATLTPVLPTPTPAAEAALPEIYFTLQNSLKHAPFDLYAPSALPNGYEFQSILFREPTASEPQEIHQIYYESQDWLSAVFNGDPYTTDVDYLYLIQMPAGELPTAGEETPIPAETIVPPPSGVVSTSAFYLNPVADEAGQPVFTAVGEGTLNNHKVTYLTRRDSRFIFQLWSYHLNDDALTRIADSLVNLSEVSLPDQFMASTPAPGFIFDPGAPGSCENQQPMDFPPVFDGWENPLRFGGYTLGQSFSETHTGVDLVIESGRAVSAARDGEVIFAGRSTLGYGLTVVIAHHDFYSLYANLSVISVTCGEPVTQGQAIGATGMTGNASAPHLHFEIRDAQGVPIDPAARIDFGEIPAVASQTPEATFETAANVEGQPTASFMDEAYEPESPGSCGNQPVFSTPPGWTLPLASGSYIVGQGFASDHTGIDLEALSGTDVLAARAGVVVFAGWSTAIQGELVTSGNLVVLAHGDGYSLYGHLRSVLVTCGEVVQAGQVIGIVGATGTASGPHLHFEILDKDRQPVDPAEYIDF